MRRNTKTSHKKLTKYGLKTPLSPIKQFTIGSDTKKRSFANSSVNEKVKTGVHRQQANLGRKNKKKNAQMKFTIKMLTD
jgi:hypothetical protein